jgi:hypothetical protein
LSLSKTKSLSSLQGFVNPCQKFNFKILQFARVFTGDDQKKKKVVNSKEIVNFPCQLEEILVKWLKFLVKLEKALRCLQKNETFFFMRRKTEQNITVETQI